MPLVERSGERVARLISRRRVLARLAGVTFSVAAATALKMFAVPTAYASYCPVGNIDNECACNQPQRQCPSNYCNNGHCYHCSVDARTWNYNGCWCTNICITCFGQAYWVCCDCHCVDPIGYCGCQQQISVSTFATPLC